MMRFDPQVLHFPPLRADLRNHFSWRLPNWWEWFCSHRRCPSEKSMLGRLRSFDGFITYHGCRPLDVTTYYQRGLLTGNISDLNRRGEELFYTPEFPFVTRQIMDDALRSIPDIDDGKLFVVLDEIDFVNDSAHYMIYGSEHLCGVGASLMRATGRDFRQILKRHGKPTLVRIALPQTLVDDDQVLDLARHLCSDLWDLRKKDAPPCYSWSFILRDSLPSHCIMDHIHPNRIPDPLLQYIRYDYESDFPSWRELF